jgi:hypothetical protein
MQEIRQVEKEEVEIEAVTFITVQMWVTNGFVMFFKKEPPIILSKNKR